MEVWTQSVVTKILCLFLASHKLMSLTKLVLDISEKLYLSYKCICTCKNQ